MRDMKDEEVPKRVNADYAPSLFALLNKFINTDNRLIEEFYKKDERTVYSYRYICKDDSSFGEDFGRIYSDLEYYRGNFKDGERVLLPIKHFLGGDIDEETFAKACEIIKKQEEVKEEIRYLNMTDKWKEKLGIKEK